MAPPYQEPQRHTYRGGRHRPENVQTEGLQRRPRVRRGICRICLRPKAVHPYRTREDYAKRGVVG